MTEESPRTSKDEAYWNILSAALELDFKKGHLKWTISDLSRKSKVTRSLIYYYFGRSKMSILEEAIKIIGEQFAGLNPERNELWKEGEFTKSIQESREVISNIPYLCAFYISHRENENEIGEALKEIEKQFLIKIKKFFPQLGDSKARALFSVFFGVCFTPVVKNEDVEHVTHFIKLIFSNLES